MVNKQRLKQFDKLSLAKGGHSPGDEMCAMEAAAWLVGDEWSDHPSCVSPVLGAFLRSWNDALDDEGRQGLKPYIPRVIGTAGDGMDERRAWMATDWLVRVCAPAWLELAGVTESSAALRALPPITAGSCAAAQPTISDARKQGAAAWAATRAAAGAAAWAATRAAAGAAAWAAPGDAAGAAAWAAAGDAAGAAAWAAAGDAAWAATGAAAWAATGDAAWAAAWAAAGDAARDALVPTKVELQASAHVLLDAMIGSVGLPETRNE